MVPIRIGVSEVSRKAREMSTVAVRIAIFPHVRSFSDRDGAVVFDVRKGKYYSFNGVAGRIWIGLQSGRAVGEIAQELSTEFSVARERVDEDVARFIADAREKRLLSEECAVREPARPGALTAIKGTLLSLAAFPLLAAFDIIMHAGGFRALHGIVQSFPLLYTRTPDVRRARHICECVNRAAAFYFKRAWCLQRSATAVCFLRMAGYSAELVIGAQKTPFFAHAWAELLGVTVNDHENHLHDNFVVLERC